MANATIDTLLLFSLPASGKSEVRRYMDQLTPQQCRDDFNIGTTLQLDDYPYVHLMHRIDDLLLERGWKAAYYRGPNRPFIDEWTWAALIELLNEDYRNLVDSRQVQVASAAQHLFDRLDAAHQQAGRQAAAVRGAVAHPPRGGRGAGGRVPQGAGHPQQAERARQEGQDHRHRGRPRRAQRHGLPAHAAVWLRDRLRPPLAHHPGARQRALHLGRAAGEPPQEHRARPPRRLGQHPAPQRAHGGDAGPVRQGRHGLPAGADRSSAGTIRVDRLLERGGKYEPKSYYLPVGRFDNRTDRTSFVREPKEKWAKADVERLHGGLKIAFEQLRAAQPK